MMNDNFENYIIRTSNRPYELRISKIITKLNIDFDYAPGIFYVFAEKINANLLIEKLAKYLEGVGWDGVII